MRSSIKVILDGEDRKPVIKVKILQNDDDDLGDQVFQMLNEEFAHESSWCSVEWKYPNPQYPGQEKQLIIRPVTVDKLNAEFVKMQKRLTDIIKRTPVKCPQDIPRRALLPENVPAELAIRNAMLEVEKLPADVRLTNAIAFLQKAFNEVADFIDDQK